MCVIFNLSFLLMSQSINQSITMASNLTTFKQDRVFSAFVGENFNLQTTIASINKLPFNEQLAKISLGIEHVKQNINSLTSQHCEEFFQRTAKLEDLYQELQFIRIKSQNLNKTLEQIKAKLETPYQQLLHQIALLSRLQKTCDLLRKMLRVIHLSKRVYECNLPELKREHEQVIYLREIVKVSQYLNEIDLIIASDEEKLLYKLDVIRNDLQRITEIKADLAEQADHLLASGGGGGKVDSNSIGASLQVYHNLGLLDEKLRSLMDEKCAAIAQTIANSMNGRDFKSSSSNAKSTNVNHPNKVLLRANLKSMLETIATHFLHVCNVVKLLKKRRDHFNQNLLIEYTTDKEATIELFWIRMMKTMAAQLTKQTNESSTLKHLIESDYPRVLSIFLEFWRTLTDTEAAEVGNEKSLRSVISSFESAYLSNSLLSFFESVNRIFAQAKESSTTNKTSFSTSSASLKVVSIPSEKDIEMVVKNISNELSMTIFDAPLTIAMCKNVLKTINLFMVKCEHLALVDGDSSQVIGTFTTSQRHNALLVRILHHFGEQIHTLMSGGSYYSVAVHIRRDIEQASQSIDNLILNIFEPLISSIQDAIEAIILTMHNEDFNLSSHSKPDEMSCSLYMKELQRFILRVSQDYLKQFPACAIIEKRIQQMASTTIDIFLLHICMIRPVSELGRRKINTDCTQLELSIGPICERMGQLGFSYQVLRAFNTLVLRTPAEIATSTVIGNPVPYNLILHYLISNYGPVELQSPAQYMSYSINRYIKWVNNSKKEEQLSLFNEILDSYVKQVRQTQKTTFAPVYPILVDLLKKALADEQQKEENNTTTTTTDELKKNAN